VGLTTAALQGTLPSGFSSSVWSTGAGLYPYLTNFFPHGAQAVSGFAYSDGGATPLASGAGGAIYVGARANGVTLGTATTGANGYYYILTAAGGVPGSSVLAYGNDAATLATATGAANTGLNLYGDALTGTTSATTYSAAISSLTTAMTAAANGNSAALAAIDGASGADLTATGASFIINQAVTTSGAFSVTTTAANAPITVAQAITINGPGDLILDADGALAIDAPIDVTGAGAASLADGGGYGFGLSGSGFLGSLSFTGGQAAGARLKINGSSYKLVYSMSELASDLNGASGDYALATTLGSGGYAGAVVGSFGGTFTGLGNYITDLFISGSSNDAALFGTLTSRGVIRDLGLVGGSVAGSSRVGALVGSAKGQITDVYSTTSVSGGEYVGGLVGVNSGTVTDARAIGQVTGSGSQQTDVGGLAGYNSGNISDSSAGTGDVSAIHYVGGLVGYNTATGTLSDDTTSGASVSGTTAVGGLAGYNGGTIEAGASSSDTVSGGENVGGLVGNSAGTITDARATGTVSGATHIGGLAGYNSGNISGSNATGTVTGEGGEPLDLGGLVGENGAAGEITQSQATGGSVIAPHGLHIGGLVGANDGEIDRSFATKTVGSEGSGSDQGGLVGYNAAGATIANTYSTGQVEAASYIGGLVGDNAGDVQTSWDSGAVASGAASGGVAGANAKSGVITDVYWDVGTTGRTGALGRGALGSSTNVTGIGGSTGKNPDSQVTYTGFNFTSIWTINAGASRPYLRNISPQTAPP